ncbi:hypothetical protein [Rheinheimera sp.]|uniref:hypothetical protein n=1 Tax=Rheinheimera sp. TaxID=1869214 RepID=UPI00307DB4D0
MQNGTSWQFDQLTQMHQRITALQQLAGQPDLVVLYQGRAWHHRDFLELSLRFALLAKSLGHDVRLYEEWFAQEAAWFCHYGLDWRRA